MKHSQSSIATAVLALLAAGCGARTGLDVDSETSGGGGGGGPTRSYSRIGLLGTPGAYDVSRFMTFLRSHGSVTRTQTGGEALTEQELDRFDLIVVDDLVRDYTPDEARLFGRWVEAGGGTISMTGYANDGPDTTHPNSLFTELGVSYVQPLLPNPPDSQVISFADHPLTQGLDHAVFKGGYAVTDTSPATPIAFIGATTVALAKQHGEGRVYLWGDEWIEFTTQWSDPETKRFWSDALRWLSHED